MAVHIPLSTAAFLPSTEGTMVLPLTTAKVYIGIIQATLTHVMLSTDQEHNRASLAELYVKCERLIARHT